MSFHDKLQHRLVTAADPHRQEDRRRQERKIALSVRALEVEKHLLAEGVGAIGFEPRRDDEKLVLHGRRYSVHIEPTAVDYQVELHYRVPRSTWSFGRPIESRVFTSFAEIDEFILDAAEKSQDHHAS